MLASAQESSGGKEPDGHVDQQGQLTLPETVRKALRLKPGDQVDFIVSDEGEVQLRAAHVDVRALRGFLHRPGRKPVSLEAMKAAISRVRRR